MRDMTRPRRRLRPAVTGICTRRRTLARAGMVTS